MAFLPIFGGGQKQLPRNIEKILRRGEKNSLQQNQPLARFEAQNLSNKSLTISNPFEDIIPIVVKLD
jgi:hypothetical protein